MDEAEKRRLKKLGKERVRQQSEELQRHLEEANPAPIGSDEWVRNYKAGTERERALRAAVPDRMTEREALEHFVLHPTSADRMDVPVKAWYAQCANCRDLIHMHPSSPTTCQCGALMLWLAGRPEMLQSRYREGDLLQVVKLIGRGESTESKPRPWWRFW